MFIWLCCGNKRTDNWRRRLVFLLLVCRCACGGVLGPIMLKLCYDPMLCSQLAIDYCIDCSCDADDCSSCEQLLFKNWLQTHIESHPTSWKWSWFEGIAPSRHIIIIITSWVGSNRDINNAKLIYLFVNYCSVEFELLASFDLIHIVTKFQFSMFVWRHCAGMFCCSRGLTANKFQCDNYSKSAINPRAWKIVSTLGVIILWLLVLYNRIHHSQYHSHVSLYGIGSLCID